MVNEAIGQSSLVTLVMTFVFFCGMSAFSWSPPAESRNDLICCRCSLALAVLCKEASKADKASGVMEGSSKRTCQKQKWVR